MFHPFRFLWPLALVLILPGCVLIKDFFAWLGPPATAKLRSPMRDSLVERLAPFVRPDLDRLAPERTGKADPTAEGVPARFKRRLVLDALKQPWDGLANLEGHALLLAELAEGGAATLPGLLDVLEAGMDRTSTFHRPIPLPTGIPSQAFTNFLVESLAEASQHRDKALSHLSEEERHFLFQHAGSLVNHFTPQSSDITEEALSRAKSDLRFMELLEEHVDYSNLIAAAQVLGRLANERWLQQLSGWLTQPLPRAKVPNGITGDVLYAEETSYGLIVIGGTGANTYELDRRFGLVIDLGGDDVYRGMIAASADADQGNGVVIDVAGNDTYISGPLGLATGRLGVGLLIDQAGDDVYQLDAGAGGTGFGGLGILFDAKGNDVYMGSRLSQGAAIGGLGLLFDADGNDRHTSHGFAIGFGGPSGVGAVVDLRGDDRYECGEKYPSAYNPHDAPSAKPGDPLFQYDCFGLGTGAGTRLLARTNDPALYNLAGGWGVLIDVTGQDTYRSANFSQAHGYFFGAGVLLDLDGQDEYIGARFGHGSAAHYGASVFVDRTGDDRYGSTGPFYNGGVAWDHSASVMIDGGKGRDEYHWMKSTGLGTADYSGWGLFIEEGGNDVYQVKTGLGRTSERGVAGFFDLNGNDQYTVPAEALGIPEEQPKDQRTILYPKGGLFVDR
ncbi:MAG TPA: hypothetical protein VFS39_06330 [Nitrospira sp.]|nr:hypothetical protein [Nitrospira sp.]